MIWLPSWCPDVKMPVVDSLGDDFLETVKTGDKLEVREDGTVIIL